MDNIKRIETKRKKRIIIVDSILIIICLIYAEIFFGFINNFANNKEYYSLLEFSIGLIKTDFMIFSYTNNLTSFFSAFLILIISLVILIAMIAIFTFPISIICLAIRNSYKRNILDKTTFKSIEGIEFFREKLKNISPATISIVTDLEIEYKKDIVATIMKLYMNKNIDFNDNKITILSLDTSKLKESEVYVLNKIASNNNENLLKEFGWLNHSDWNNICVNEAEKEGYIKITKDRKKFIIRLAILILIFLLSICVFYNNETTEYMKDEYFTEMNFEQDMTVEEILSQKELFNQLVELSKLIPTIISGILAIVMPIYIIIYSISYRITRKKYKRTKKGKELLEKIYGMKNFIHEYSLLDEAKKEYIKLWDEFLIYAIVLEENSKIIDEIYESKGIKRI